MITFFKIVRQSVIQALQELNANKLRSFLSLLGISIGIFCIIGVLAAVDSLEQNVRGSVEKLGDDVLYVQKLSWAEDPGANYFKYLRRPSMQHQEYERVKEKVRLAENVAYYIGVGTRTIKYRSSSVDRSYMLAVSFEFADMFKLEIERGRFLSSSEYAFGSNKVILGYKVAEQLFGEIDPIGRVIKVGGRKMEVIGVLEKAGDSIVNVMNFDEVLLCSYEYAKKIANLKRNTFFDNSSITVKAREGVDLEDVKAEVTGVLRAQRRLKPKEENNFSINELSIISQFLNAFFGVLSAAGFFIGIFAIVVGAVSVANIMFVSVKERTKMIGIKKAIGAKRWVILVEFLIESILLCLTGGIIGLLIVGGVLLILSHAIEFEFYLSVSNIIWGITGSAVIGVVAGMIPAINASGMDPVKAMRK